ncbi:hypothetical protein G6F31_014321 [Rhizopus arrhizus]|nr:hypothetical protein G6F31_014321 [Rhizopus arrhizus]
MRIADVQLSFPAILIALLIDGVARAAVPREMHELIAFPVLIGAIALAGWPQYARTVRGSTLVEKNREYVQAARVSGGASPVIMCRHVLPNGLGPVLVLATVHLATAIITEATLSFLGVGVPVTSPSLGTLIRIGNSYLFSGMCCAEDVMALLNIEDIRIEFPSRRGTLVAVDGVSLSLEKGEILGGVGESGAGKSTIGNAVIGLLEAPGRLAGGSVLLNGERIDTLTPAQKRKVRGRRIGMIFQDPLTSLDPLQTVESQLVETMQVHLNLSHAEAKKRAVQLLVQVGIDQPELRVQQYPHQFSGGMRQRVVIALALCCEPEVIIADEPTTALDVSIQAQILELLKKLCREEQVGMIIITHDMGVIADAPPPRSWATPTTPTPAA